MFYSKLIFWHRKLRSIIAIILCLSMLTGCVAFEKAGSYIADVVVDKYDPKNEFDSSLNDLAPTINVNAPNGVILYETILLEDILKEKILIENILEEQIFKEIVFSEKLIFEDVIVETVLVEIIEDVDDLDSFICESYYSEQLDYSFIRQRLSTGLSLVLAEIVVDTGSAVINILTANWGGLAIDAGQIILTAGGTTLMAFIEGEIAKAKSLAAGNSYEVAMYDCLDAASSAYYYTAVVVDVINTFISTAQLLIGLKEITETIYKNFIKADKIYNDADIVIGKALKDDKRIELTLDGKKVTCKVLPGDRHLYDVATQQYVGTLDKTLKFSVRKIPSEIYSAGGNLKYTIKAGNIYNVTKTASGEITETIKGSIDAGGIVKNGFGQIVEKIDFDTGKAIGNFTALTRSLQKVGSPNITVDVFGELIDINTGKAIKKNVINGITTYIDESGKALLTEYVGKDGVTYIKKLSEIDNGKTLAAITDGIFDGSWKNILNIKRSNATKAVRIAISKFVQDKPDRVVRKHFPQLTMEQIEYIRATGKLPTNLHVHHIKNVANYPDLADDISNLEILTYEAHLEAHGGDFHSATTAASKTYVELKQILVGYFE